MFTGVKSFMLIISFAVLASSSLAAESNVTTLAPITIAPNPPMPDPKPALTEQELNFHIMDKDNVICALFSFIGSIYLPATSSPKANETTIPLSNLTTKNPASSCDKNRTSLVLNINGDVAQNLNLTLYHTDSNYQLNIITLKLANKSTYLFNDTLFSVDDGKSYICSANPQVELVNQNKEETKKANLQLRKLKVDAFRTANGTDYRYG